VINLDFVLFQQLGARLVSEDGVDAMDIIATDVGSKH
jgi:hypothetical protein